MAYTTPDRRAAAASRAIYAAGMRRAEDLRRYAAETGGNETDPEADIDRRASLVVWARNLRRMDRVDAALP